MTKYYFVRHGESAANVDGVVAGWSDVQLTLRGEKQAYDAAQRISDIGLSFDIIISSPLSRALNTAKIIAQANRFSERDIRIITELKEKTAGSLELGPLKNMFEKTEDELINLGGESAEMFRKRVILALKNVQNVSAGHENILVVAHAGVYKMARVISEGLEPATQMYDIKSPKNAKLLMMPMLK